MHRDRRRGAEDLSGEDFEADEAVGLVELDRLGLRDDEHSCAADFVALSFGELEGEAQERGPMPSPRTA